MTLWTIQPYCVYETLQLTGIYRCNSALSTLLDSEEFINAYNWISNQMKKTIGNPPENVKYPVWAWYSIEGENKRPDMRERSFKVHEKSVLLEIEIPDSEVLLTDFDRWHFVINNIINYNAYHDESLSDEDLEILFQKIDEYYDSLSEKDKISYKEKSWEKIICTSKDSIAYIQATFWELKTSQIRRIWILKK